MQENLCAQNLANPFLFSFILKSYEFYLSRSLTLISLFRSRRKLISSPKSRVNVGASFVRNAAKLADPAGKCPFGSHEEGWVPVKLDSRILSTYTFFIGGN